MLSSEDSAQNEITSCKFEHRQGSDNGNHVSSQPQIPSSEVNALHSDQEVKPPAMISEKILQGPDALVHRPQSDQEGSVSTIVDEKVTQTPDASTHAVQCGQKRSIPSRIREKVSEDGYNWRKYGQKLVKGNEFVRSYYKCTQPNCQVKKQLECSHDGKITDTVYLGQHDHPKHQLTTPVAVGFAVSISEERPNEPYLTSTEEKSANAHGQTPHQTELVDVEVESSQLPRIVDQVDTCDALNSKRQKKGHCNLDATPAEKGAAEPRVVQTLSEVDIVNDGYRWRKYGQKLVRGNQNPRSYYRCSSPRCPAKKHVERSSNDPKVVITMYDGQHDHDMPPARTVTHNIAGQHDPDMPPARTVTHNTSGPSSCTTANNTDSGTKSDDGNVVCLDSVVHTSSGTGRNSSPEGKSNEQQNDKSGITEVRERVVPITVVHPSSDMSGQSDQPKSGEHDSNSSSTVVNDNINSENNLHKQQTPNAEPVQS